MCIIIVCSYPFRRELRDRRELFPGSPSVCLLLSIMSVAVYIGLNPALQRRIELDRLAIGSVNRALTSATGIMRFSFPQSRYGLLIGFPLSSCVL